MRTLFAFVSFVLVAVSAQAQNSETLADIRQELTVLNVEVQKLRRELSTTGSTGATQFGGSVLARVDGLEAELRRLTAKTEELQFRIDRVVEDGTRRIGDLEFRLVELEGGDLSQLGETSTLGGEPASAQQPASTPPTVPEGAPQTDAPQLAVGEEADFAAAREALEAGDYEAAARRLSLFNQTYPGSPLGPQAQLAYGAALEGQGDVKASARAYLDAFRLEPNGETAPEALFRLGRGLGRLGQTREACTTLAEVGVRFPGGAPAERADAERSRLGCQ